MYALPDGDTLDLGTLADSFKALSDPNRLRLLFELLGAGLEQNVGQTAGCCNVDLSVVSRHLAVLHQAGILTREKRGKAVLYGIDQTRMPATFRALADALEFCCPPSFNRIREKEK